MESICALVVSTADWLGDALFSEVGVIFLGSIVALYGIVTQRNIARRQYTVDQLFKMEDNVSFLRARREFVRLATEQQFGLVEFAKDENLHPRETSVIRRVLNNYELIGIGVQRGTIDLRVFRLWGASDTLRHWAYAAPFIYELRRQLRNDRVYREFENLVDLVRGARAPRRGILWGLLW